MYFLASSTPSSTLSALVPWPMAVGAPAFPPALPPTTFATWEAHSGPEAPLEEKGYVIVSINFEKQNLGKDKRTSAT